ncbi:hypothetical protein DPMN_053686 [Dreissena polymorpha]|uniref:Uncharacterized protein n=1 Tax=Dreissena polymorpha TaxID=45954 RepID=A0A9D4CLU3_DREPO|nr:hypothetical protein DPMN_053686 [Dreissena polymorpha]
MASLCLMLRKLLPFTSRIWSPACSPYSSPRLPGRTRSRKIPGNCLGPLTML